MDRHQQNQNGIGSYSDFAKKLTIQLPVEELKEQLISKLNELFSIHQGDFNVTFELLELEKVKRFVKREIEIDDEIQKLQTETKLSEHGFN